MSECDEDGCVIVSPDEWLAKKIEQKIIEDSRKKIESGFAAEPRESIIGPVPGDDWQATNFNTEIVDVELKERVNALFPPYMVDEMSFAPGSINGWIRLDKHLDDIRVLSDLRHNHTLEIRHLIATNRALTILLIFSTAFGITAALAWLRCQ